MVLSASNRKTFTLSLNLSSAKSPPSSPPRTPKDTRSSKEHAPLTNPQSPVSLSEARASPSSFPLVPSPPSEGPDPAVAPFLYSVQPNQASRATLDTQQEKMGFIRKVRKLSKALVDIPQLEISPAKECSLSDIAENSESPESSASDVPSAHLQKLPKRSATYGRAKSTPRAALDPDIQRSRSLASLKSTRLLGHSSESVNITRSSPVSIVFSIPTQTPSSTATQPPSSLLSPTGVSNIILESKMSPGPTYEFLSKSPPSSLSPRPRTSPHREEKYLSRRSSSSRRAEGESVSRRDSRRRLSLDLRSLAGTSPNLGPPRPTSPSIGIDSKTGRTVLKRSRSMWTTKRAPEGNVFPDFDVSLVRELGEKDVREPMTDWERILNVRRTRKLQQLFGDKPPPALYQITNVNESSVGDAFLSIATMSLGRRDSRATLLSVVSSTIPQEDSQSSFRRERSVSAASTSSIALSPLVFKDPTTPPALQSEDAPATQDASEMAAEVPTSTPPSNTRTPSLCANTTLHSHSRSRPPSPAQSQDSQTLHTHKASQGSDISLSASSLLQHPASSPSPSTVAAFGSASPAPAHEPSHTAADFRLRRLRAAKLSRFFGVGLNDLAPVLPSLSPSVTYPQIPPAVASPPVPSPLEPQAVRPASPTISPRPTSPVNSSQDWSAPISHSVREFAPFQYSEQGHSHNASVSDTSHSLLHGEAKVELVKSPAASVEVAAEVKHTFGFGHRNTRHMDMQDVIHQLRRIK